jgi:hypothetical protein|tara:strand:- start:365 stop:511 length:147 start_codon:yes stop_codon:yes gene_type:complete
MPRHIPISLGSTFRHNKYEAINAPLSNTEHQSDEYATEADAETRRPTI